MEEVLRIIILEQWVCNEHVLGKLECSVTLTWEQNHIRGGSPLTMVTGPLQMQRAQQPGAGNKQAGTEGCHPTNGSENLRGMTFSTCGYKGSTEIQSVGQS